MRKITSRKPGRKKGFSFGRPALPHTIRVRADQKQRGQALATYYRACDEVLRAAIDLGLSVLEAEQTAMVALTGNPIDW